MVFPNTKGECWRLLSQIMILSSFWRVLSCLQSTFANFLIWFWTQSGIGVKGFIFINRSSNVLERKKKKMLDMNKRERARPFYITSLPAYLYLQARCANGRGREPRARFFLLTGTAHLTFLLRELSDLRENCVLLPAKVFYWLELLSTGTHLKPAYGWVKWYRCSC